MDLLTTAKALAERVEAEATQAEVPVAVCVIDIHGNLVLQHRMNGNPAVRRDVLNGLASRPRTIPARWFYDRVGSELFEAITSLPEYYATRNERALLCRVADEVAALAGPGRAIQYAS